MTLAVFMSGWGWVLFSLLAAAFSAQIYLLNQYMKVPGYLLVFWSRVATVVLMTPFMPQTILPDEPIFYAVVLLSAVFGAFADIRTFNVAARYGGGVVSRVMPLIIILTFFLWFFFDPEMVVSYERHPVNAAVILIALSGCIYFSSRLGKCHISRSAFLQMLPALLAYTVTTVLNKYALQHGPLTGAVFGYLFMQSAFAVPMLGAYVAWHESRPQRVPFDWRTQKMLVASVILAVGWICSMALKTYAMAFIPNPAYQAALNQMTPVFIAMFYWHKKHKEEADVSSGMGIVFCTALLVLATAG